MVAFELLLGFALLIAGGDVLVRGSVALAVRLGLSPLLIGLTIVGFGTSMPELVTSLQAAFDGVPGIAVGNVVGSNVANILLILGIAVLIAPFAVSRRAFMRDGAVLLAVTLGAIGLAHGGEFGRLAGAVLLAALAAYLILAVMTERRAIAESVPLDGAATGWTVPVALLVAVAGIGLTIWGARLLVGASVELATYWGVSDAVIGLTVVAVGTSLPELATSVVAAFRREGGIAFGNVIGSNIFNLLGIVGTTALVHPIAVPPEILEIDVWVMLAATLSLGVIALTRWRVVRAAGVLWLAAYGIYLWELSQRGAA